MMIPPKKKIVDGMFAYLNNPARLAAQSRMVDEQRKKWPEKSRIPDTKVRRIFTKRKRKNKRKHNNNIIKINRVIKSNQRWVHPNKY